jgi:hypothetical protein
VKASSVSDDSAAAASADEDLDITFKEPEVVREFTEKINVCVASLGLVLSHGSQTPATADRRAATPRSGKRSVKKQLEEDFIVASTVHEEDLPAELRVCACVDGLSCLIACRSSRPARRALDLAACQRVCAPARACPRGSLAHVTCVGR